MCESKPVACGSHVATLSKDNVLGILILPLIVVEPEDQELELEDDEASVGEGSALCWARVLLRV